MDNARVFIANPVGRKMLGELRTPPLQDRERNLSPEVASARIDYKTF